eukprot:837905_1
MRKSDPVSSFGGIICDLLGCSVMWIISFFGVSLCVGCAMSSIVESMVASRALIDQCALQRLCIFHLICLNRLDLLLICRHELHFFEWMDEMHRVIDGVHESKCDSDRGRQHAPTRTSKK